MKQIEMQISVRLLCELNLNNYECNAKWRGWSVARRCNTYLSTHKLEAN
jgi:hypothetical protein